MKILVLLAHPVEKSLNHGIAHRVRTVLERLGHVVFYHDLYKENFDPLLTPEELLPGFKPFGLLKEHCDQLISAEGIVIIHPNWRDQAPAVLKGWIDRVIRSGVAFKFSGVNGEEGHCLPNLKTELVTVFNTSDCSEETEEQLGDPLEKFWKNIAFGGCGVKKVIRRNFCNVFRSTSEIRGKWLDEVESMLIQGFSREI
ncbi:MAG: NAD(P)H-dependent oxidoreductase [Spirochaetales bacterium]|nr:NAD(P)H-dependent oxidoreductase [Spirochaetales bacterium]